MCDKEVRHTRVVLKRREHIRENKNNTKRLEVKKEGCYVMGWHRVSPRVCLGAF